MGSTGSLCFVGADERGASEATGTPATPCRPPSSKSSRGVEVARMCMCMCMCLCYGVHVLYICTCVCMCLRLCNRVINLKVSLVQYVVGQIRSAIEWILLRSLDLFWVWNLRLFEQILIRITTVSKYHNCLYEPIVAHRVPMVPWRCEGVRVWGVWVWVWVFVCVWVSFCLCFV